MGITRTSKKLQPKTQEISAITYTHWCGILAVDILVLNRHSVTIFKGKLFSHFCECISILHCDHPPLSSGVHLVEWVLCQQMKQRGYGLPIFWPKTPLIATLFHMHYSYRLSPEVSDQDPRFPQRSQWHGNREMHLANHGLCPTAHDTPLKSAAACNSRKSFQRVLQGGSLAGKDIPFQWIPAQYC